MLLGLFRKFCKVQNLTTLTTESGNDVFYQEIDLDEALDEGVDHIDYSV